MAAGNTAYPPNDQREQHSCSCCDCCGVILVVVFFISFDIFLFTEPLFTPSAPRVAFQSIYVVGLNNSVLSSNSSTMHISPTVTYEIAFHNPNKYFSLHYDDIDVTVKADEVTIGAGSIASFDQGKKDTTVVTGRIGAIDVTLDSDTVAAIANSPTTVPLSARVDFRNFPKEMTQASCNLVVDLTRSNGSQLTHGKCEVNWYS